MGRDRIGRDGTDRAREPGSVRIGLDGFVGIAEVVDVENVEKLSEGNVLCVCWTFFPTFPKISQLSKTKLKTKNDEVGNLSGT